MTLQRHRMILARRTRSRRSRSGSRPCLFRCAVGVGARPYRLPSGPRRAANRADELGPVLFPPEIAHAPRPGGRWAVLGARAGVPVGGNAAEQFLRGDDPVLLGNGEEAGCVGHLGEAAAGDGVSYIAENIIIIQIRGSAVSIEQ
jgi:hypothetical protein